MSGKTERNAEIVALFSHGIKKSEIARRLGVSVSRVSQILKSEERKKAPRDPRDDIYLELGCMAANALKSAGYHTKEDILLAIADGTFAPNRIKQFGKKSLDATLKWVGVETKKKKARTCPHCGMEI